MNKTLEGKNALAIEGLKLGLEATEKIYDYLIDEIDSQIRRMPPAELVADPTQLASLTGRTLRLSVQRDLLVDLKYGVPKAILEGDASILARIPA